MVSTSERVSRSQESSNGVGTSGVATSGVATDIESLKREHARLDQERRNAQANLNAAQNQLDQLRTDARKEYGTDDLDLLREKLQQMKSENERKRADYQAHLEGVRAKLGEVE